MFSADLSVQESLYTRLELCSFVLVWWTPPERVPKDDCALQYGVWWPDDGSFFVVLSDPHDARRCVVKHISQVSFDDL